MVTTKSWMEILSPTSAYFPDSTGWILGGDEERRRRSGHWTQEENKMFENALADIDSTTPDRWERVAAMLPGKTVGDVISHYRDLEDDVNHIEAGLIPFPGYTTWSFTLADLDGGFDGITQSYCVGGRKRCRLADHERKKGVPWTEEEHRLFLLGLSKHGKGDWRNISRNFVVSRTPTQVASHAQKYYNRLNSGGKDKRRASIHDITIANLADYSPPAPSHLQPSAATVQSTTAGAPERSASDQTKKAAARGVYSPSLNANRFPKGTNPFGIRVESQNSYRGMLHDSMAGHCMMLF